jgi:hypothetical protein
VEADLLVRLRSVTTIVTKMVKGTKVKVQYYPKCSSSCIQSCSACIVEAEGKFTGRLWNPSDGNTLYEVKYKKKGQKKYFVGVFLFKELEPLS